MEETENQIKGANDFEFLVGSWRVRHRRLKERLASNHHWIEFEGTCVMQKILGGAGNMDEHVLNFPGDPYRAVAVRIYDAAKRKWSIWWIDGRKPGRINSSEITIFDGTGVGIQDVAASVRAYELALERGAGTRVGLG